MMKLIRLPIWLAIISFATTANAENAKPIPKPSVTVSQATINEVIARVPISGTLVPKEEVLVNPQVTGYEITELTADIGDTVSKGDVLAVLNNQTLMTQLTQSEAEVLRASAAVRQSESQIDSAKANLVQAVGALERAQKLRKSGNLAQATLDQNIASEGAARASLASSEDGLAVAKAQLESAKAQRDLAKLNLSRAKITAPVNGIISAKTARIGAIASAGAEPLFRLIKDGIIELEAEVIETSLGNVNQGDLAKLSVAGIGELEGRVRLVAPTVDPVTRLGIVKIEFSSEPELRSGLFAGGWIITDQRNSITVPATAVLIEANQNYVLAVDGEKVIKKSVRPGLIWNNMREIISGLEEHEVIISKAGAFFADGDMINPVASTSEKDGQTE